MKKILMRGGMTPFDNLLPETVIANNSTGRNSGNLFYAYGVYRTLMTEDTMIDVDYYGVERFYTDKEISHINEKYDAYVCPLADAFRDTFENELIKYADFFDKLTIPCYVIGVGLKAKYEPNIGTPRSFDEAVKKFVKAVLKKSAIIGLRGEVTGEYLNYLGFREDVDYMPIGCPSIYALGANLAQRPLHLSESSKIAFNLSKATPKNVIKFALHEMQTYRNHYLIEQDLNELRLLYNGTQVPDHFNSVLLPQDISHPLLQENRYHVFFNIPTWLSFLRNVDLSVGSKLHGTVAAALAGCPVLFMPRDSRTRELAAYHSFPAIPYMEIKEEDHIEELLEKVDLTSHLKKHHANFERFVSFLNKIDLAHIYQDDIDRAEAPLDRKMRRIPYQEAGSVLQSTDKTVMYRIAGKLQGSALQRLKTRPDHRLGQMLLRMSNIVLR